ncbi:MAG TPA: YfhO family protein, partial [Acidimicrobiales bacterium]|nr:YfhO family protein [Acidimicrobiales bacterium]
AGQAEILTIMGLGLLVFLVVLFLLRAPMFGGTGPTKRPILDLVVAFAVGGALGAPLILPGVQIIRESQRAVPGGDPAELIAGNPPLPLHSLIHLAFQGFDGLPTAGNKWFGYIEGYSETAAYVGVIAIVLAVMAVAVRRRRPEVVAFGAVVVAAAATAFVPPLVSLLYRLPVVGTILWQRALLPLVFGVVVLAAVGMDSLVRANDERSVRRWAGGGFAVAAVVLLVLWVEGRGHLPPAEASTRAASFIWPVVATAVGLVAIGLLVRDNRRSRRSGPMRASRFGVGAAVGLLLLACETAFLLVAGAPLWTSASTPFSPTRAEMALKSAVGSSVVGFGAPLCFFPPGLGILPNAQLAYGVQELGLYDPLIPSAYFSSWSDLTHKSAGNRRDFLYCPVVTTAAQARLYGVSFVLEPGGTKGPQGSEFDTTIGDEDLYRIPRAAVATLTPLTKAGTAPPVDAEGKAVVVTHPNPASWKLVTNTAKPQVLRLRLTDVPGWRASVDGRAVPLHRFAGVMLQVDVPGGRHVVELDYWPITFTVGIVVASCAAAGLIAALAFAWGRGRRSVSKSSTTQRAR